MHDVNSLTAWLKNASVSDLIAETTANVKAGPDKRVCRTRQGRLYCFSDRWNNALIQRLLIQRSEAPADLIWPPAHLKNVRGCYDGRYPFPAEAKQHGKPGQPGEWRQISTMLTTDAGREVARTDRGKFPLLELTEVRFG